MSVVVWVVILALVLFALTRGGDTVLRAYAIAPAGIGVPVILLILFLVTEQMRGMMTATLGGYSHGVYNEHAWHQTGVPIAVVIMSLQGWFWTRASLNGAHGRRDQDVDEIPGGERWAARLVLIACCLLGILPAYVVGGWRPWDSREVPWLGVGLSVAFSLGLGTYIVLRRNRIIRAVADMPDLTGSRVRRLFVGAPWGPWAAAALLATAIGFVAVVELAPGVINHNLHTTSAVLLAASCTIPIATVWLALLRDGVQSLLSLFPCEAERARRIASVLGTVALVAIPFFGSKVADQLGAYDVGTAPPAGHQMTLDQAVAAYNDPACHAGGPAGDPIVVAVAGGASRSAAWSLSVLRMLDAATGGVFSQRVFAFSTVSGGSLGAMTYELARAQPGVHDARDEPFLVGAVELARYDLLPDVAARLVSFDPLTGIPTRGWALAEAFDEFWADEKLAVEPLTFLNATSGRPCQPQMLLNGVDVESGARLMTSSLEFGDQDHLKNFVEGRDIVGHLIREQNLDFRASAAVLNSARFPIVSPPGRVPLSPSLLAIDGGTYEGSGVSAALELTRMLATKGVAHPILVIISDNETDYGSSENLFCEEDKSARYNLASLVQVQKTIAAKSGGFPVPELLTSVAGLNATRATRYYAELARVRDEFCADHRVFVFDLPGPKPAPRRQATKTAPVPMNWVLTSEDCAFMFGEARLSPANLAQAAALTRRLDGAGDASDGIARLREVLDALPDAARCKP